MYGSPYRVEVLSGQTSAEHSLLVCGDGARAPGTTASNCPLTLPGAVAGVSAPFYAIAKDAFNNTNAFVKNLGGGVFYYTVVGSDPAMGVNTWSAMDHVTSSDPGTYCAFPKSRHTV